ncbi:RHS repeat-associated core domain-containing protein [Bacillus cereus VD142]|nr:RHS repeat-associated core domain-containing protein [Bacillus cereus]EJP94569.1 RHS repeat-associated core domain-containing protein [Bacillus cereus VD142]
MTDQNRELVATYEYDSWGNVLKSDTKGIAADNPFGYAGYMYDKEIGTYYLMARYYNPDHGVFLSVDPDPGDEDDPVTMNGYTYGDNNPVMMVDPDGHWVWIAINAGFAAYDGYKAYKAGGNWKEVGWAVASNYVKPLKIAKKALGVMTQRQAFRAAKRAAGIPTSAQFKNHKFVYDGKTEHRTVYSFGAVGRGGHNKFVVQHKHDKSGRGPHFHAAGAKTKGRSGNPLSTKGKYNQLSGHYPEDKKGYKKKRRR